MVRALCAYSPSVSKVDFHLFQCSLFYCMGSLDSHDRNLADLVDRYATYYRDDIIWPRVENWETALLLLHLVWVYWSFNSGHYRSTYTVSTIRRCRARYSIFADNFLSKFFVSHHLFCYSF